MKKVFAAGIALAVLMGSQTVMAAPDNSPTTQITASSDFAYTAKATEALNYINSIRQKMGLGQVTLNPSITKAAENHAKYIFTNASFGHSEKSGDPGFTGKDSRERLKAIGYEKPLEVTLWEVISFHTSNVKESVDAFMDSAYHREPLMHPNLKEIGVGISDNNVVIDMALSGYLSEASVYPYDGQRNVRTWFRGFENPNPIAKFGVDETGYIISYTHSGGLVSDGLVKATLKDSKGNSVPFFSESTGGYYFMYPKKKLAFGETYTASVDFTPDFGALEGQVQSKTWSFTTASSETPAPSQNPPTTQPTTEPTTQPTTKPTTQPVDLTQFNSKNIGIKINGQYVDIKPKAMTVGGSTFIPLRGVFEAIGAEVTWLEDTKSILIKKDGKQVYLTLNSKTAYLNGKKVTLAVAPFTNASGSSYVPLRFASETMGAKVGWDGAHWTATIDTNN